MRRSKIVCTLGPAVDSHEMLVSMIEAGMNVGARSSKLSVSFSLERDGKSLAVKGALIGRNVCLWE